MPSCAPSVRPHTIRSPSDQTELNYQDAAVFVNGDAIHAAVFGKEPLAVDFEIFGIDTHGVIAFGRHGVFRRRDKGGIGRFL